MKRQTILNIIIALTLSSYVVSLVNVAYPTEYFIPDRWYKIFYVVFFCLMVFLGLIIFFIDKINNKKVVAYIFFQIYIAPVFFLLFSYYSIIGKRIIFLRNIKSTTILLFLIFNITYLIFLAIKREKKLYFFTKKTALIFSPIILLITLSCIQNIFFIKERNFDEDLSSNLSKKKRVVWMVFDEFDKKIVFDTRKEDLFLKNFEKLKKECFFAEQVTLPGRSTNEAIPALTTGLKVDKFIPVSRESAVLYSNEKKFSWEKQKNVFEKAKSYGYKTAVVGWHHRYNRIFGEYLDYCFDDFTCIDFESISDFISWVVKSIHSKLFMIRPNMGLYFTKKYQNFFDIAERILDNRKYDFVYIHWPFPHRPAIENIKIDGFTKTKNGYYHNLLICDEILKRYRKRSKDKEILIICSDHHLRGCSKRDSFCDSISDFYKTKLPLLVPLMIKFPELDKPYIFHDRFHGRHIHFVVDEILKGNISTYEQLATFLKSNAIDNE